MFLEVINVISYALSILFLILISRAVRSAIPEYWSLIKVWWLKKRGYTFHYFNNGKTKVLAKDRDQAYRKYKEYKHANRKMNVINPR